MVLARTVVDDRFAHPEVPRWQISGQGDLTDLGARLYDTTGRWRTDARVPDAEDCEVILDILNGRFALPRCRGAGQ